MSVQPRMRPIALPVCLALMALACGDEGGGQGPADAGLDVIGDVSGDVEADLDADLDASEGSFGVVYAFSGDGSTVSAVLGPAPIDPVTGTDPSNYVLVASDDTEATVTAVTFGSGPQGATIARLELETPLDATQTWELTLAGVTAIDGSPSIPELSTAPVMGTVLLNLVWHQHQPSYLDPAQDELQGPWVRKHATKDYFDMTAILAEYPDIHLNVNLTSSLLNQLQLYVDRLGPYVDVESNTIDEEAFLAEWAGRTDPWIDLLLNDTPTPEAATDEELGRFYGDVWSTRSIAEPLRSFFPEYDAILDRDPQSYTQLDLLYLKLYFEIAWMDPDFLRGPVVVYHDDGSEVVVDLSDVVVEDEDGLFRLDPFYTTGASSDAERLGRGEALANRLVAENYKIMVGVFDIHRELIFDGTDGQIDVLTTPFYHPILPLLQDTDLASEGQPADPLPTPAFSFPADVGTQLAMAVEFYTRTFGQAPRGMWPSEGAVAEEIIPAFLANGIEWIATDRRVLERGLGDEASHLFAYRIDGDQVAGDGGSSDDEMMIVFRDTALADKVSFFYQGGTPDANALDFFLDVLQAAHRFGEPEQVLTVIADGENAWEFFTQDHDAKGFFNALYGLLERMQELDFLRTVTGSEYIDGNAARGVDAHPISGLPEYEDLFPGSWIDGTLATWIGEAEENLAWVYLRTARVDLAAADALLDITLESLLDPPDGNDAAELAWWNAWRAMYAAEGSDWFWWYGSDQTSAGGDDSPFDEIFRAQLVAMYGFMNEALTESGQDAVAVPGFPPVLQEPPVRLGGPFEIVPILDGMIAEGEWIPPAGAFFDSDAAGADLDPDDDVGGVLYGYADSGAGENSERTLYVAIQANEDLSAKLETDYRMAIYTSHLHVVGDETVGDPANDETEEGVAVDFRAGGVARQIAIDFSGATAAVTLAYADGDGGWNDQGSHTIELGGPVEGGDQLELAIPFSDLGLERGDPLELMVVASSGNAAIDIAPNIGTQVVFADPTVLVTVIFELDVTGETVPIDTFVQIADPPPPAGTGTASIVGNQDDFANWTPNTIFMADDGEAPDATAGDNIWTHQFLFSPATGLQYKYTIGSEGDSWGGTEEYPLTNRGYTVPADGTRVVRIRDIFADRPDPSGTMATHTTVTVVE